MGRVNEVDTDIFWPQTLLISASAAQLELFFKVSNTGIGNLLV